MKPEFASIETTLRCNMTCKHCGVESGPHAERGRELETQEMLNLFGDLYDLGVRRLVLSGGEFTTRKDWRELLGVALTRFTMVRQISNGWYGKRLLEILEEMPNKERLALSLSVDGMKHSHDLNRRAGSFGKLIEILEEESAIYRTVITTVTTENWGDLDDIFAMLRSLKVPVWSIQIGLPAGYMLKEKFIGKERIYTLADTILGWQAVTVGEMEIVPDNCFGYDHPMRHNAPWEGCQAGKNLVTILANGDVTGCPTTFWDVRGNIREQSLEAIWNGNKMEEYRKEIPTCGSCANKTCKGGCRAVQHLFGEQFCDG